MLLYGNPTVSKDLTSTKSIHKQKYNPVFRVNNRKKIINEQHTYVNQGQKKKGTQKVISDIEGITQEKKKETAQRNENYQNQIKSNQFELNN